MTTPQTEWDGWGVEVMEYGKENDRKTLMFRKRSRLTQQTHGDADQDARAVPSCFTSSCREQNPAQRLVIAVHTSRRMRPG